MAAAMVDRQFSSHNSWHQSQSSFSQSHPPFSHSQASSVPMPMPMPVPQVMPPYAAQFSSTSHAVPPHNSVELNREQLIVVLNHFSQLLAQRFERYSIRLVVHGGACMLLHPGLYNLAQQLHQQCPTKARRKTTRDVDYVKRSFVAEMASFGVHDAEKRLQECIMLTAKQFHLGADWMNSDADVALPMAHHHSGQTYDPIYQASVQLNNIELHTIYRSPNGMLTLISVTPFWAVSLKLVRYTKWDPDDICLLLRNGTILSGVIWNFEKLRDWLYEKCWPMGYHNFDDLKKRQIEQRIHHAIEMLANIWNVAPDSPQGKPVSAHDAMGGNDMGEERSQSNGWSSTWGQWPNHSGKQSSPPKAQNMGMTPSPWVPTIPQGASFVAHPAQAPPPNVRDWGTPDPGKKEKKRRSRGRSHHSRSKSRTPSRERSLTRRPEVFIPPDVEWVNPNHAPGGFRPNRSRNASPSPPIDDWHHDKVYESKSHHRTGSWQPRIDLYGLNAMGSSMGAALQHGRNGNTPHHDSAPVIPVVVKSRRKKDKQRKKQREMDRQTKWAPRSPLDETDSGTDDSSSDEENVPYRAESRGYQIYASPSGKAGMGNGHSPFPAPAPQMKLPPREAGRHNTSSYSTHLFVPGPGPQADSRNVSPNPPKHRPPPLDLPPGFNPTPPQPQPPVAPSDAPALAPAQLAQIQFERQHAQYQQQRYQQEQQQQRYYQQQPHPSQGHAATPYQYH